jgi:hypothetical protein
MAGQSPAYLPHIGLVLDAPGVDSPAPLPHLGLLGGLGRPVEILEYGSFTVNGQVADLKRSLALAADVGYIGLYGQVGLLTKQANSSGEAAPFPSMGTLFIPTYNNRTLTCDPGIYTYVGNDGLVDLEINGETTTYSLSGQDAGLNASRKIAAEQGSYSVSGQDAAAIRGGSALVLSAEHGLYDISGTDAGVRSAYSVPAEFGFHAILGQIAVLSVGVDPNTNLTAEYGTYEFVGGSIGPDIAAAAVVSTGAPGRGAARRERYLAIINGKKHWGTREEIERLIESLAETQAEKPKKKRAKIVVKPADPVSTATPEDKIDAAEVQADVRQMYEELYRRAVAELELQEEEDLIGLL